MASSNITTDSINSEDQSSNSMKIRSNDGKIFEIDEGIIEQSSLIKEYYDLFKLSDKMSISDKPFPLPNVDASLLIPILKYCNYHKNDKNSQTIDDDEEDDLNKDSYEPKRSDDISTWDREFIQQFPVQDGKLIDIIKAANYLGIKSLIAVGLKTIANMVRGKSASEVRDMFAISINQPDEQSNALETDSTN